MRTVTPLAEAHLLGDDERDAATALFARCFAEEPWNAALVEVLPSCEEQQAFLLGSCRTDLACFAAWGGVLVASRTGSGGAASGGGNADVADGDTGATGAAPPPVGLALVGGRDMPTASDFDALRTRGFEKGCEALPPQSRTLLSARLEQMEAFSNGQWMGGLCTGDFRYLYAICVDAACRGTGAFDHLMGPVAAECDRLGMPLFLECYTGHLAALYGSRGFEVTGTTPMPDLGLTEYRMIRQPQA